MWRRWRWFVNPEVVRPARELPRHACPTLLLMGQGDQLVPAAAGEAMRDLLLDARSHVFSAPVTRRSFSHLPEFVAELQSVLDA